MCSFIYLLISKNIKPDGEVDEDIALTSKDLLDSKNFEEFNAKREKYKVRINLYGIHLFEQSHC